MKKGLFLFVALSFIGLNSYAGILTDGNVGIGNSLPTQKLEVTGNIAVSGTVDGKDVSTLPDGSGSENYITKWTDSDTLQSSIILDNGTNIGIGTTNPLIKLDMVTGGAYGYNGVNIVSAVGVGNNGNYFFGNAGNTAITGEASLAAGHGALSGATNSGSFNVALGQNAMTANTTGHDNVAVGLKALQDNTTGYDNAAIGINAGRSNQAGYTNTFLGRNAGYNGSQKIDAFNSTAVGYGAYTTKGNQVVIGNASVVETLLRANVGIATTNPGSALDVKGTIRLSGATSGYVGLSPAATAGSTTYTLPAADGTVGQVLSTSGAGVLSWANAGVSITGTDNYMARFNAAGTNVEDGGLYDGSDARAITIDINENVGIGTTNPGQKLEVNGAIKASYKSSDGTSGVTVTTCTGFKDGLCISGT